MAEDGLIRVSPSQIKTWRRCERKWAFEKIEGLKGPTSDKMQFGTDCHKHMENWIKHGKAPPNTETGNVARQLIRGDFIPAPSPTLARWTEKFVSIPMQHIHPMASLIGYSDLIVPPDLASRPIVNDFKFTSSLRWAMSKAEAEKDPQSLVYGRWGMDNFNADVVEVRFLYGVASNPKTGPRKPAGQKKLEIVLDRNSDEFKKNWEALEDDVVQIVNAKLKWKSANKDAEPNAQACNDFGGCPFQEQCDLTPARKLASLAVNAAKKENFNKDEQPMNLMDKINSKKNEAAAPPPPPPEDGEGIPLMDRLKAKNAEAGVNPEPEAAPEAPPNIGVDELNEDETEVMMRLSKMKLPELKQGAKSYGIKGHATMKKADLIKSILPHELERDEETPTPVKTDSPKLSFMDQLKAKNAAAKEVIPEVNDMDSGMGEILKAEGELEQTKENAKTKPDLNNEDMEPDRNPVKPNPNKKPTSVPATRAADDAADGGLMVLFDCVMRKGSTDNSVENLADWMKEITEEVAKDNELPHWSLIDYKAPATLAAALEDAFKEKAPAGCIMVDSYSLEGRAVKDVLIKYASFVIQGVR